MAKGKWTGLNRKGKSKDVDRQYRRMERSSRFWNRIDPANRFRHWYMGAISVTRSLFRVKAAWQTVAILVAILSVLYVLASFYTGRGEFIIKLDRKMADDGFAISETMDFSENLRTLHDEAADHVTNITLADIPPDVMDVDGKHNGQNYVAFTFYLKNKSLETHDYRYELMLISASKKAETAAWVMLFKNGTQQIYAQKNKNGYPECLYSEWEFPFAEYAEKPESMTVVADAKEAHVTDEMIQYHEFSDIEGLHQLETVPWESGDLVCSGNRQGIEANEVDKYTVVIWIEGDDPDCVNDIIGGHVEMRMKFYYY